jgi:hypothetical protein
LILELKLLKSFRRVLKGARLFKQWVFIMSKKRIQTGSSLADCGRGAGGKGEIVEGGDSICGVDEEFFEGVHSMVKD